MRGGASKAFHGAENVRGREIQNTERRRGGETVVFMENPQNICNFCKKCDEKCTAAWHPVAVCSGTAKVVGMALTHVCGVGPRRY